MAFKRASTSSIKTDSATVAISGIGGAAPEGNFIKATGGTVTTDGVWKIHTFTSTDAFTVTQIGSVYSTIEVMVVGGGGAGGMSYKLISGSSYHNGTQIAGSGAEIKYYGSSAMQTPNGSALTPTIQSYTVSVGAGGSIGDRNSTPPGYATDGTASSFVGTDINISSAGGVTYNSSTGAYAGSGSIRIYGPMGTSHGQGTEGTTTNGAGGGRGTAGPGAGGWAGEASLSGIWVSSGDGGKGLACSISGTTIEYAGGGAAGQFTSSGGQQPFRASQPGCPGAGAGGWSGNGGDAQPNTGAGGGGFHNPVGRSTSSGTTAKPWYSGGAGGSGVVIVRYRYM